MQAKLNESNGLIRILKKELDDTKNNLVQANFQLSSQNAATESAPSHLLPKLNQPENIFLYIFYIYFLYSTGTGKKAVLSWTTHMSNYLCNVQESQAMTIAVSYLQGTAHEWWINYKDTEDGKDISTWIQPKQALASRFDTLNKQKIARDRLVTEANIAGIKARIFIGDGAELNHISKDFCEKHGTVLKEKNYTASRTNNTSQKMQSTMSSVTISLGGYTETMRSAANPLKYDLILGKSGPLHIKRSSNATLMK